MRLFLLRRPISSSLQRTRKVASCRTCSSASSLSERDGVGKQQQQKLHELQPTIRRTASVMEDRVALGKLPHMLQVMAHLPQATRPQVRSALLYWISKPVQEMATSSPSLKGVGNPTDLARNIVDYLYQRFRDAPNEKEKIKAASYLNHAILGTNHGESCNNTITRLVSVVLQPLQGTNASLRKTGVRHEFVAKENVHYLLIATRLFDMILELHASAYFPALRPDRLSLQTHLNLISKRTKFLVFCLGKKPFPGRHSPRIRRGVQWSAESTIAALAGHETARELVESANRVVKESTIPMEEIHYSLLASIYSDASFHENGMADAAMLHLTNCPKIAPIFNPILLAYTREAERHHLANRHSAALHSRTQCESVFQNIRVPDAISYSILLKLYKYTPETAQRVLGRLPNPQTLHYNSVLDAWAKANRTEQALTLLRQMETLGCVDRISYTTVLGCCSLQDTKDILNRCVSLSNTHSRPDNVMYTTVFSSHFRRLKETSKGKEKRQVAIQMQHLLEHLLCCPHFQQVTTATGMLFKYYNSVFRAWAYVGTPLSVEQCLALLDTMMERGVPPNGQTYQNILAAVAQGGNIATAARIFESMEDLGIVRTTTSVTGYIRQLLAQCESDEEFGQRVLERLSVKRADSFTVGYVFEGLFQELTLQQETRKKIRLAKNTEALFWYLQKHGDDDTKASYNDCIRAWAFSFSPDAAEHTFRLLKEMKKSPEAPNSKTYEYILTCFSRNPSHELVNEARALFAEMEANRLPVSLSILNCFLRVLVRSGTRRACLEAESLAESMENNHVRTGIAPNEMSYELIWRSYMKMGSLMKADGMLEKMERAATRRPEMAPTVRMRKEMMEAWSESFADHAMDRVNAHFNAISQQGKPDSSLFASLQAAWCRSKRKEAAKEVEAILVKMQSDFESGSNPLCQPTVENFNAVIHCLANQGDAERAEAVLNRMEELSKTSKYASLAPNTTSYEEAIRGWSLCADLDTDQRVLRLLEAMKQAWLSGRKHARPTRKCYDYALESISRSRNDNKAQQCYLLLKEMILLFESGKNRFVQPSNDTVLNVLRSCSTSSNSEALSVAMGTMEDYLRLFSRQLSSEVFVQFLYALFRLLPVGKARDDAVMRVLLDSRCSAFVFSCPAVRDALSRSVSRTAQDMLVQKHQKPSKGTRALKALPIPHERQ